MFGEGLSDKTHRELFEALVRDEYIQDNLHTNEDFQPGPNRETFMHISFVGDKGRKHRKALHGALSLEFDKDGTLTRISVGTREVGQRRYSVASTNLIDTNI